MRPSSIGRSAARQRNMVLLPQPFGPGTATVSPVVVARATCNGNRPSVRTMRALRLTSRACRGYERASASGRAASYGLRGRGTPSASCLRCAAAAPAEEPVAKSDEHAEGDGYEHEAQHDRLVGVDLITDVDRDRHGLGTAGEVAGEGNGRAELAQRPSPGEHRPGDEPRTDGRHRDPAEDVPA